MTERQTILALCRHYKRKRANAIALSRACYGTPAGRQIAIDEANVNLWKAQQRALRYRRSEQADRDREAVTAWRAALGMDRYDNIAAE